MLLWIFTTPNMRLAHNTLNMFLIQEILISKDEVDILEDK